jgi:hypothetical protein
MEVKKRELLCPHQGVDVVRALGADLVMTIADYRVGCLLSTPTLLPQGKKGGK